MKTVFKYIVTSSKLVLFAIDLNQHRVLMKTGHLRDHISFFFLNAEFVLNSMGKDRAT